MAVMRSAFTSLHFKRSSICSSTLENARRRKVVNLHNRNASPTVKNGFTKSNLILFDATAAPEGIYEAVLPDTSTLIAFAAITALCVIAGFVWANQVVPVSRTKLAISKSRGEVKKYLDGLREEPLIESSSQARTEVSVDDGNSEETVEAEAEKAVDRAQVDGRGFERWLFADWLRTDKSKPKDAAIPILKKAKWNSGDNPVLVASALIGLGVIFAAVTERVSL